MAWTRRQKGMVHIYAQAASLEDADYRQLLRDYTGAESAADRKLTQEDFEDAMAALEGRVAWAVKEGVAVQSDRIRDLDYWRSRKPDKDGRVTSRQLQLLGDLLRELEPFWTSVGDRSTYIAGIIRQALGYDVAVLDLASKEAGRLIDALKDRLAHHQRMAARQP